MVTTLYEMCGVTSIDEVDGEKTFSHKRGIFIAGEFLNTVPSSINVLPKPGTYAHAVYGDVKVSMKSNGQFVENFNGAIYQKLIPIDLEHEGALSGAVGYYEPGSAFQEADGSVTVGVRWEERGAKALQEGRFYYFSPEWFDSWKEPLSGKIYNNVLIGGALTTRPYFKDANLRPLYASELKNMESIMVDEEKKEEVVTTTASSVPSNIHIHMNDQLKDNKSSDDATTLRFTEMEKRFKEQEDQLKKANELIARQAKEVRKRKFSDIIMGRDGAADGTTPFPGDIQLHAEILDVIWDTAGEEDFDSEEGLAQRYIASNRSLGAQIKANSKLTQEIGGRGVANPKTPNTVAEYETEVAKVMSEKKVSDQEARRIVASDNPKLYNAARKASYAPVGNGVDEED